MSEQKVLVDNQSAYGTFSPSEKNQKLINLMRRLPKNWLGKRLMFTLRRRALKQMGDCADIDLFDANMRLYTSGNVSEKRALFAPQFFDLEEREALQAMASDNAVFIDIGANVGLYSFSTAQTFKNFQGCRIISVEPHPETFKRLTYNISLNPDLPIEPVNMGLGDKAGTMTLLTPENNLGETRLLKEGEHIDGSKIDVPVETLLGLLNEKKVSRLDGMKIDIEGYEEAVLTPFFEQAPDDLLPIKIIIENNFDKWKDGLLALAGKRGYKVAKTTRMNLILERSK